MPVRYAILHHSDVELPHFDLMFETLPGSTLATWRSLVWPIDETVPVTRLRDHRRFYLEYEGDLSDYRGRVERISEGTCEVEVGEHHVWTIRLLTGTFGQTLRFTQIQNEQWEVEPAS